MPLRVVLEDGTTLSFEQALTLKRLRERHAGHIHWHLNDCECCITVHAPGCAYVIGQDGQYDRFEGRGCKCPAD